MDDAHFTRDSGEGFTLLELLLVVTILGAVAWLSVESATDNMDQVRFDKTKRRIAAIKRAIIGDSSRTLNGEPVISGYVADMGGVPEELRALVLREYCLESPEARNSSQCGAGTWISQTAYNGTAILPHGWRGPYLTAESYTNASGGRYVGFKDGWGTSNSNASEEYRNFGWNYTAYDSSNKDTDIILMSYGRDGKLDGDNELDADYPPGLGGGVSRILINKARYKISGVNKATVDFGYLAAADLPKKVCLQVKRKLYRPAAVPPGTTTVTYGNVSMLQSVMTLDTAVVPGNSTPGNSTPGNSTPGNSTPGNSTPVTAIRMVRQFSFNSTDIYMGEIAYSIVPYDNTSVTPCNTTEWRTVKVLPEAGFPTLYWSF